MIIDSIDNIGNQDRLSIKQNSNYFHSEEISSKKKCCFLTKTDFHCVNISRIHLEYQSGGKERKFFDNSHPKTN